MVVQLEIVQKRDLQIGPAVKASLLQEFVDAAVEPFRHAVGLRMARRCRSMLDSHGSACFVERVFPARLLVFDGKSVSKLRAVVGQYLVDLDREIFNTLAASRSDRPESLISCRIFGVVRAWGWMRLLMDRSLPDGSAVVGRPRRKTSAQLIKHGPRAKQGHAAARNMLARD